MASPTWAEITGQISNAVHCAMDLYTQANGNQVTLIDTYTQALEGDNAGRLSGSAAADYRAALSSAFEPIKSMLDGHMRDLLKLIDSDAGGPEDPQFWEDLHRYMHANSVTFNSRDITYGTITGSTGTGNMTLVRLTVDWNNYDLEDVAIGTTTAECFSDQNTGETKWREAISLSMDWPKQDYLEDGGIADTTVIYPYCGDGLLSNASFQTQDLANNSITGWTSNVTINTTNYGTETTTTYRTSPEERASATGTDAPKALEFKVSSVLTQKIRNVGTALDRNVPYCLAVAYYPNAANVEGNVKIRAGTEEKTAALSSPAQAWNVLALDITTDLWLVRNKGEDDLAIDLEWDKTTATIFMDDVQFGPMYYYNGTWWFPYHNNASPVACLVGWQRTFTDTAAADSEIMKWLHWFYGRGQTLDEPIGVSLPTATGAAETVADPS